MSKKKKKNEEDQLYNGYPADLSDCDVYNRMAWKTIGTELHRIFQRNGGFDSCYCFIAFHADQASENPRENKTGKRKGIAGTEGIYLSGVVHKRMRMKRE